MNAMLIQCRISEFEENHDVGVACCYVPSLILPHSTPLDLVRQASHTPGNIIFHPNKLSPGCHVCLSFTSNTLNAPRHLPYFLGYLIELDNHEVRGGLRTGPLCRRPGISHKGMDENVPTHMLPLLSAKHNHRCIS